MAHPQERSFELGAVRVIASLGVVEVEGRVERLEPRVMRLLVVLSERPLCVLSREALLEAVWGEAFVGEEVLTQAVSVLRRALGDDCRDPRYVETVPKRGYRLLVRPTPVPALGRSSASPEHSNPDESRSSNSPRWWVGMAAGIAAITCAGLLFGLREWPQGSGPLPLAVIPLTTTPGRESQPALSPSGDRVAYVWSDESSAPDLYLRRLGEGFSRRLTRDAALEGQPAWSPDGTRLAFPSLDGEECTVRIIHLDSGLVRRVHTCSAARIPYVDWGGDGSSLVVAEATPPADQYQLSVVDIASGERRLLTTSSGAGLGDRFPAVSPKGTEVAFVRTELLGASDLWIAPMEGGGAHRLTRDGSPIAGISWSDDGRSLVSSVDHGDGFRLWSVPRDGGQASWLVMAEGEALRPSIRGRSLVFERPRFRSEIWRAGPDGASPLLRSTRWDEQPAVSPDGSRLVFVSDRSGSSELWIGRRDGSGLRQLTRLDAGRIAGVRWAPDGRRVALSARRGSQADVFVIDVETAVVTEVTQTPHDEVAPAWSRDGGELFFLSERQCWGIWRQPLRGGEPSLVAEVLASALWAAPEGDALFVSRFDRPGIWKIELATGALELVDRRLSSSDYANWGVVGGDVFFLDRGAAGPVVRLIDDERTGRLVLPTIPMGREDLGLTLAPDGEVLFTRAELGESDLIWVPEL